VTPQDLLSLKPFTLDAATKRAGLLSRLNELTTLHMERCSPYRRIVEGAFGLGGVRADELVRVPFLPVRLFKTHDLKSIDAKDVFKTLTSSGTTTGQPSRVALDRETAMLQARLLLLLLTNLVGKERVPMLIADYPPGGGAAVTARYAATLGVMNIGRDHLFCLDQDLGLRRDELRQWYERHRGRPVVIFGFTFLLWKHLCQALEVGELDLPEAIVLHTGGWKKLQAEAVDNATFKRAFRERLGVRRVHNFYGMAEQVGTVFIECEQGVLHASDGSDVIVRDPVTWAEVDRGGVGVVQCLSALPTSYPGHSLLTEDLGRFLGEDDCRCGRLGRYFEITGRVPRAELRGCSDTRS
jgi:hypothetical protein